ncbi:hypothetical protein [uncultured Algimonas sp.]|uniref:hypothetical protein n=1 Tax=uncultured Algimonas sp. TaxID=1547920 RepID=UPI00261AC940|nr:hypothetical protein [uncultured Algimonas sp.]
MTTPTRQTCLRAALAAILLLGATAPAHAQFKNLERIAKKEVEKKAAKEIRKVINGSDDAPAPAPARTTTTTTTTSVTTTAAAAPSGGAAKPTELTQCDGLKPTKVVYGRLGEYTFQKGMSTETRTGFIDRRNVSFESGCILPNLRTGEVMYLEYDTDALKAKGEFETQCVKIDDRAYGALNETETRGEYPTNDSYLGEAHMRLACGNSEGVAECTSGSNGDRATAADQDLKARGQTALSFLMSPTRRGTTPKSGERLYCQYYNPASGKSLFGYEYFREYG